LSTPTSAREKRFVKGGRGAAERNETEVMNSSSSPSLSTDLVCFSHLRWDFVYQRPQHLLSRFAAHRRVFVVEEPILDAESPRLDVSVRDDGLRVVVPHLPAATGAAEAVEHQREMLERMFVTEEITDATFWYYTAMAMPFTRDLPATRVIYDCMDELAAFANAPAGMLDFEIELFRRADHVFTGGHSLYEAKAPHHHSVHAFPSSIDPEHFAAARGELPEPGDLVGLEGLRIGFYGVIDERADLPLIDGIAALRPEWNVVLVGPVMKVEESSLPRRDNIHYLGSKSYADLPSYLAHWDVAMMPFALNESTRFISPTKTPEYLAAGKPVVSTAIRDVVRPYGDAGVVHIASGPEEFVRAAEAALGERRDDPAWLDRVDALLKENSWDATWAAMATLERDTPLTGTVEALDTSAGREIGSAP
jgi:glycosyltransferase involved in cell wall biosynthesis